MPPSPSETLPSDPHEFARNAPLTYGTWGQFKRLYKTAETNSAAHPALLGMLAARLDQATLAASGPALPVDLGPNGRGVTSLAVDGRRVFCLLGNSYASTHLAGYDFHAENLLKPILLGSGEVTGGAFVTLCGPFVGIIGSGQDGLLSLFDPASSAWRGRVALGSQCQVVSAYPHIYATVQGRGVQFNGLRVVDLTNPDQPAVVAEIGLQNAQGAPAIEGNLLALAANGLRLFDVSRPRSPRALGTLTLGNTTAVALRGSLALVGTGYSGPNNPAGLHVIDISNPANPRKLGLMTTGYTVPKSILLNGDYAYIVPQYGGQPLVIDLRTPDQPKRIGEFKTYAATQIVVSEDIAYVGTPYNGLELYSVVNPGKPTRIGIPPRGVTIAYMKRRARRFLRTLAKKEFDQYAALAYAVLAADTGAALDPADQWVSADILYGASDRYIQRRHGRGLLVPGPARFRLRTREERASEAWDRHPELASALLANSKLPWQTQEAAYKMLRSANAPLPEFSDASLEAFLSCPAPLLTRFAARTVAARLPTAAVSPKLAALAYVQSGVQVRCTLAEFVTNSASDMAWVSVFVQAILERAVPSLQNDRLPRRLSTAIEFAAEYFPSFAPADLVKMLAAALLHANRLLLTDLVLTAVQDTKPGEAFGWLQLLEGVPEAASERVVTALVLEMAGQAFPAEIALPLVVRSTSAFIREASWRLLAGSRTEKAVLYTLWTTLLDQALETPALRTAMSSAAALSLLERAGIDAAMIAERLRDKPFLAGMVTGQTFAAILPTVPASVTLGLIGAASDEQWTEFRPLLLRRLSEGIGAAEFWLSFEAALASDDGALESRLLADPEVRETITLVDDPALLNVREPALDVPLGLWAAAHEALFTLNSRLLLQAATHVLPTVRTWALERVRTLGMDLPFALKLMESALPSSLEVGTAFFEALPTGDPLERTYALVLCDSPFAPVRAIGQRFVTVRWATLPHDAILSALFENSHAEMQAFVAAQLGSIDTRPDTLVQFDSEVLRTHNRSRLAKELVKTRQTAEPTVDTATLLALARSRTPRDAEWALMELAKLALSGVEIEGVSVSEVAGG